MYRVTQSCITLKLRAIDFCTRQYTISSCECFYERNKNSKARFSSSECSLWGLLLLQHISILIPWSQHFALYSLIVSLFRNATTNILPQHRSREKSSLVKISAEIFIRYAYSAFFSQFDCDPSPWAGKLIIEPQLNNWQMRWPCEQGKNNNGEWGETREREKLVWKQDTIANIGCIQNEPAFIPQNVFFTLFLMWHRSTGNNESAKLFLLVLSNILISCYSARDSNEKLGLQFKSEYVLFLMKI